MKRHIIVYGLTQSGVQTASSLVEGTFASSEKTFNLGSYFKVAGDRYLSHDGNGLLLAHPTPESATSQPFFQTYRKSNKGIVSCFDYATSRIRSPEEEFKHRLRLLQEDETDTVYVSNLSAVHENQFQMSLNEIFQVPKTEVIILDPRNNLSKHAKHFFGAHQKNIWTTVPGTHIETGQDISFTPEIAEKFKVELELLQPRLKEKTSNTRIISSELVETPLQFASSLGLSSANNIQPKFKDAEFKDSWKPADFSHFQNWIKTLQV